MSYYCKLPHVLRPIDGRHTFPVVMTDWEATTGDRRHVDCIAQPPVQARADITELTDYPYFPLDQNKNLQHVGLSAADIQAIEGGNALRLLPQLKPA